MSAHTERAVELNAIVYATDFTPESLAAAPYAISLAQEHQAYLSLLHVIQKPEVEDLVHPAEIINSSVRQLRELLPIKAAERCVPEYLIEVGVPSEKILEIAKKQKADLIVLGVRSGKGHAETISHFAGGIAYIVVTQAHCSVLTVRG